MKKHENILWIGGTLWTVAVLLKPELVLLSIVFVLMKRWKFCLASVGSMLLSIAVSLAIWGVDAYTVYGSRMSSELALLAGRAVYYNQSLSGVIARFGVYEWSEPAYVGITIAFIVCFLWLARSKKMVFPTLMWVAIPVFLIIEPIAWQHHLVYLLPTYLWIWDKVKKITHERISFVFWISYILVSLNIKNPLFLEGNILGVMVFSHGFIGCLLLWYMAIRYL